MPLSSLAAPSLTDADGQTFRQRRSMGKGRVLLYIVQLRRQSVRGAFALAGCFPKAFYLASLPTECFVFSFARRPDLGHVASSLWLGPF